MLFRVESVGSGIPGSSAVEVMIGGVLKRNETEAPWEVANEAICGALAAMLGLPAPPGAIVQLEGGSVGYVSMRFGERDVTPPPLMNEGAFIDAHSFEAAGVVAFDAWVWNPDRHPGNVAFAPPRYPLAIFDHGDALFCDKHRPPLTSRLTDPCPESFLGKALKSSEELSTWVRRIRRIDDRSIKSIVGRVRESGALSASDAAEGVCFLAARRDALLDRLKQAPSLKHLHPWPLVT